MHHTGKVEAQGLEPGALVVVLDGGLAAGDTIELTQDNNESVPVVVESISAHGVMRVSKGGQCWVLGRTDVTTWNVLAQEN